MRSPSKLATVNGLRYANTQVYVQKITTDNNRVEPSFLTIYGLVNRMVWDQDTKKPPQEWGGHYSLLKEL